MDSISWNLISAPVLFIAGVFWQSWRASSSEIASQLNDLLNEVKDLVNLSTEYWASDAGEKESELIVKIRGAIHAIAAFEEELDILFGKSGAESYREQLDNLLRTCTGGSFETADREADGRRAVKARENAAGVAKLVRKARQDSAGLRAAAVEVMRLPGKLWRGADSYLNIICNYITWLFSKVIYFSSEIYKRIPPLF